MRQTLQYKRKKKTEFTKTTWSSCFRVSWSLPSAPLRPTEKYFCKCREKQAKVEAGFHFLIHCLIKSRRAVCTHKSKITFTRTKWRHIRWRPTASILMTLRWQIFTNQVMELQASLSWSQSLKTQLTRSRSTTITTATSARWKSSKRCCNSWARRAICTPFSKTYLKTYSLSSTAPQFKFSALGMKV